MLRYFAAAAAAAAPERTLCICVRGTRNYCAQVSIRRGAFHYVCVYRIRANTINSKREREAAFRERERERKKVDRLLLRSSSPQLLARAAVFLL